MSDALSIILAQFNPTVGDVRGNIDKISAIWRDHRQADLIIFPELCVSGYPPEDLVLKDVFLQATEKGIETLCALSKEGGAGLLIGAPRRSGGALRNAAILIDQGEIAGEIHKSHLPNYGVFDEARIFSPAAEPQRPVRFRGCALGVMVCEDMWKTDVAASLAGQGAQLLAVINGSPFEITKDGTRIERARACVAETGLPLIYVNQVGGQDELVFDGGSFVMDDAGVLVEQSPLWREQAAESLWSVRNGRMFPQAGAKDEPLSRWDAIYGALTLGLRDYVNKNRFKGVLIGLSGGIDSALCAALAVDALGPERVWCVMMPSPYTSKDSLEDARIVADLCGARLDTVDISPAMAAYGQMLGPLFEGMAPDITEENIQARARGMILMALSNKFGHMVLSTGNKSEMSVGYSTLYGDMCGGYSVLKDVYKTSVFALSRWRNANRPAFALGPVGPVMPERVITKPPSAELKPDQKDQDSLPPYDILDRILERLIEDEKSPDDLVAEGFDPETARRVFRMLDRAEYKRRQAPPGVKITRRAFGRDRRYPIVNGFTDAIS